MAGDALGGRKKQHATRLQRVVKSRDQAVLDFRFQVDHQVAATKQVEPGEGRILDDVLHGEHHHFADIFLDPVACVLLDEKVAQPLRRNILGNIGRVDTGACHGDGILVEIGGVEQYLEFPMRIIHAFAQQYRDGIGLLAGGAACHPDAEHVILRLARKQLRQDVLLQRIESLLIAEKIGDVDQQFLEQGLRLIRMLLEVACIHLPVLDVVHGHAPLDAAADGAFLVL